ncbi:MAG: hypothetical protein NV1_52 [Nanoarchaeotal virus 1]|nr:MAG: hypothetical protein NV1_52 [Nanoarchaeotal virus 1]
MPEGDYFIDVGRDNNDFKLILRDTSGNIVKVFDDSNYIVYQAWREASQLIENYDLMIYGRAKAYKDGEQILDFFKRFLFIIFLEQDASYLANLEGYRIKYPTFEFYIATLYKMYKAFVNPKSTLSPQEFIVLIGPLLTKAEPTLSGQELTYLFDNFAANYYKALDFIRNERLGVNFIPTAERPISMEPNPSITQPNEMATNPSPAINQPTSIAASARPLPPPQYIRRPQVPEQPNPELQPKPETPQPEITPPKPVLQQPKITPPPSVPNEPPQNPPTPPEENIPIPPEENKPKVPKNIKIEHKRPRSH